MRRLSLSSPVLLVTAFVLATTLGCGTGGGTGAPDAGVPDDGGVDAGEGGAGGAAGEGGQGGQGGEGGQAGQGGEGGSGGAAGAGGTSGFHPDGYAASEVHGRSLRQGLLDCRACHRSDLTGMPPALSCDSCHTPADPTAWRTDCVFCHGGVENQSGAPPKNLDGSLSSIGAAFPAHDSHVRSAISDPLDCVECHVKAADVLSQGHVFDDTPGVAEVDFGGGRSPQGAYSRATGCQSLYCHGNGQGDDGAIVTNALAMTCESCHAGMSSGVAAWSEMSGLHEFHLGSGAACQDCHEDTSSNGTSIADPSLHVNAIRELAFGAAGFAWDSSGRTCSGTCHGEAHGALPWLDAGQRFHPLDYAIPAQHSPDMELQRMDCRDCHASDLTGNLGPSCDTCHSSGWRSDCVFCHGAGDNFTGAPPRDLGALPMSASQAFLAHTAHVTQGISRAFDCIECHLKPSDVLDAGHAFDGTPGRGEVSFATGLSSAGSYNGAGSCSSLYCHGNGQGDNGSEIDGAPAMQCSSCHAGMNSSEGAWETMSGEHRKHLQENVTCGDCHLDVTEDGRSIRDPLLHVDGLNQIRFSDTRINYNPATERCSGNCHGETHNSERW